MLLPVADFEARLGMAVDHLVQLATRSRFSAAARRGVLSRTWPAICDELLEHYAAAAGTTLGRGIMTA
jgi:phosphatidylinositol alpha 1,6-mannosyltransferase